MINKDKNNTVDVNELEVSYTLIQSNPKKDGLNCSQKTIFKASSSKGGIFVPSTKFGK